MQQLDDRVVKMYKSIGGILRKYRSGKLPKAFKIVPALNNWEQVGSDWVLHSGVMLSMLRAAVPE